MENRLGNTIAKIVRRSSCDVMLPVVFLVGWLVDFILSFFEMGFLCITFGWPGAYSVDQPSLKLSNLPASTSQVLELKMCATIPGALSVSL